MKDTFYVGISRKKLRKEDNVERLIMEGGVYVSKRMHHSCFACTAHTNMLLRS
jgi:hypothetical protein